MDGTFVTLYFVTVYIVESKALRWVVLAIIWASMLGH